MKLDPRFALGRIRTTAGAAEACKVAAVKPMSLVRRHERGDWGDVTPADARDNELAARRRERIVSAYRLPTGVVVWVITESDRKETTLMLPEEYK